MVVGTSYCIFSLLMFHFTLGNFSTFHDACYCMRSELSSAVALNFAIYNIIFNIIYSIIFQVDRHSVNVLYTCI